VRRGEVRDLESCCLPGRRWVRLYRSLPYGTVRNAGSYV
jgi:hypothetical protein